MKKLMLICAPVTSRSGYGAHARDLVSSFIKHNKYDVKIIDVPWGDCPRNALDRNKDEDKNILNCILGEPTLPQQPDIYVDIRIPNEFETIGKFNIGITAGIETTAVSGKWLEHCNKMDLIIVPSEHSKSGFVNSIYDAVQQAPDGSQQKVGELKLEKPIEVLFEGADDNIYKPLNKDEIDSDFFDTLNEKVPEKFAFLFVGQWVKGNYGEDRKNIFKLIKTFYEAFANKKKQPALILKTNGATYSILDKEECLKKIKLVKEKFPKDWKLPNVYLLHGSFSDEEMNYLYNHPKIKSMISLTHGEGFGRPLLEATMTGLPVIASGWSGQVDFLDKENAILLGGDLTKIPKAARWKDVIIKESKWFEVDENIVYKAMNYSFDNVEEIKNRGKSLMKNNIESFTLDKMVEGLDKIMVKHTGSTSTQVNLKLPKLKKTDPNPNDLPTLKLPKVTKINQEEVSV